MEINKNELIKMMTEYWSTSNNRECWEATKRFAEKYCFYDELVSYGFDKNEDFDD
jgi:hypothetical protein